LLESWIGFIVSFIIEFFGTSERKVGQYVDNVLSEKELGGNSVVKDYLTTGADGKGYDVIFF
jgi:hypothetical protein